MKIIEIFVASSITNFSKERRYIAAYFCDINNKLVDKGIFFDVKFCEELDNAVPTSRKQEEYNEYISNSDYVLFLIGADCGTYTFEEFNTALCSEKHPKIFVFAQNTTEEVTEKVQFIKDKLANNKEQFITFDEYYQIESQIRKLVNEIIENNINLPDLQYEKEKIRRVTFFLGISNDENEEEKNEILRFVLGLNEKLLCKKIYVQIVPCIEHSDEKMEHEYLIDNSEVAFFVFFSKADKLSEEDLLYGATRFREIGLPKIYTYFLDQGEYDDGILSVKKYIDQTLHHYYSTFSSVDSIKLSILLQLSIQNIFSLTVKNTSIISQDIELLELNNLKVFSNNETINQLKQELDDLTNQYNAAEEEFINDRNRRDLLKILSDLDDRISGLKEKVRKEENEALSMLYEMHKNIAKGEMNEVMKKAYRHLEKGMVYKAAEILNKKTVDSYYGDRLVKQAQTLRDEVDDAIQMYKHTIHIQKMLVESEDTVNTIIACYETIMNYLTIANAENYDIVLEYAEYLDQQNNSKAESIFIKAEYLLANPEQKNSPEMLIKLYDSMGEYYLKQFNPEVAEKYEKKCYKIAKGLYNQNRDKYALRYAQICLNYARINVGKKTGIIKESLTVIERILQKSNYSDSSAYIIDIAEYYYGLACIMENSKKQITFFEKAAKLLEINHIENRLLADIYNNIAEVTKEMDVDRTSERKVRVYYDKALEILEKLYDVTPDICAEALGDVYNNKCVYYWYYERNYYQGLQCLKKCERVYLYWYQKNPRKNGQGLAECYIQMSNVYDSLKNRKKAIQYADKGIKLLEELLDLNYDRYVIKLAWAYSETGLLYAFYKKYDLSREYLCKSLDILEKSGSSYVQIQQNEIVEKIFVVISLMIQESKSDTDLDTNEIYALADRGFQFMYIYIKPLCEDKKFISTLYSLGMKLLYHFDELDHEKTMQRYYPAVMELGKQKLLDSSLSEEEKMLINFDLSTIVGLMGNIKEAEIYYHASLDAFQKTDDFLKFKKSEKRTSKNEKFQ